MDSTEGAYDESAVQSAHSGFVQELGNIIFISILSLIPLLSFGLIPLSLVFDLNASEVALLLSPTPIFFAGPNRILATQCLKITPVHRLWPVFWLSPFSGLVIGLRYFVDRSTAHFCAFRYWFYIISWALLMHSILLMV